MTTTEQTEEADLQPAVLVWIKLSDEGFGSSEESERLYDLEDRLEELLDGSNVGELDGDEIGMGFWTLYSYGPDANALWDAIQPTLREYNPPAGSYVEKLHRGPDDAEETFEL
jgi:hypothetical protein